MPIRSAHVDRGNAAQGLGSMLIPTWLLLVLGVLGATDIWLFHTRAHHLHDHGPARAELVTHALRGPTYAPLFSMVPNATFAGAVPAGIAALPCRAIQCCSSGSANSLSNSRAWSGGASGAAPATKGNAITKHMASRRKRRMEDPGGWE